MNKLSLFASLLPQLKNLKSWIFADGKFQLNRALLLLVSLVVLLVAIQVFDVPTVVQALDMLDELSDIFGYSS